MAGTREIPSYSLALQPLTSRSGARSSSAWRCQSGRNHRELHGWNVAITARTSVSIAVAIAFVGASLLSVTLALSGTLATPIANADDPLAPIVVGVTTYRSKTPCPRLTYNPILEDAAQKYARSENPQDGQPRNYDGGWAAYLGTGDPQDNAIVSAYGGGAGSAINDCGYTEFGVGFIRHDDRSVDVVTVIFGTPAKPILQPNRYFALDFRSFGVLIDRSRCSAVTAGVCISGGVVGVSA